MTKSTSRAQLATLRREAFANFLDTLERKLIRQGYRLDRSQMPGTKRDMIYLLKKNFDVLATLSEATFEEYMRDNNCKFPSGSAQQSANKGFLLRIYGVIE
jgi:hypothetical protein